jgi:CRP/FNR family transcriptional regulator, cyclic AMP receptor protein
VDEARLASIPLFASLSKRERRRVASCADEVDVREGRHLVEQGDFSYEFFAIVDGRAHVLHGEERLAVLGPGDFFGEMGLLGHTRRNASVIAASEISAVVMTGRDFRQIGRELPHVAEEIRRAVEERTRSLPA